VTATGVALGLLAILAGVGITLAVDRLRERTLERTKAGRKPDAKPSMHLVQGGRP